MKTFTHFCVKMKIHCAVLFFVLMYTHVVRGDYECNVTLGNGIDIYSGVLYTSTDAWRLDIFFKGTNETILQRKNVISPAYLAGKSTQLVFGTQFSPSGRCCQHEIVEYVDITSPAPSDVYTISRKDGYNFITITSSNFVANATLEIMKDAPIVDEECPVRCSLNGDFVILVDGSSSIDTSPGVSNGTNFQEMREFIREFASRFTINPDTFHLGLTYFSGYGSCSSNTCKRDDFCLPISGINRYDAESVWNSTGWANTTGLNFFSSNTSSSAYSCWNGTSHNKGYASVEMYISNNAKDVNTAIDRLNNYRAYDDSPRIQYTSIGSGIELSRQLFFRKPYPRPNATNILIILTDGRQNAGEPYLDAAERARSSDIDIYVVGFGDHIDYSQLVSIAGKESNVIQANFTQAFEVLNSLIVGVCTSKSSSTGVCPEECVNENKFCTACGNCSMCENDDVCIGCQFCDDPKKTNSRCVNNSAVAYATCMSQTSPNECQLSTCIFGAPRNIMCEVTPNIDEILILQNECVLHMSGIFSAETCQCTHTPLGDGNEDIPIIIAGSVAACCLLAMCACCLFWCICCIITCMSMFCAHLIPPHLLPFLAIPLSIMGKKADATPLMSDIEPATVVGENPLHVPQEIETENPLYDM